MAARSDARSSWAETVAAATAKATQTMSEKHLRVDRIIALPPEVLVILIRRGGQKGLGASMREFGGTGGRCPGSATPMRGDAALPPHMAESLWLSGLLHSKIS